MSEKTSTKAIDIAGAERNYTASEITVSLFVVITRLLAKLFFLSSRRFVFEIYKDEKQEWRWRLVAPNNKIIATSGEGYINKADCEFAINLVRIHGACSDLRFENGG